MVGSATPVMTVTTGGEGDRTRSSSRSPGNRTRVNLFSCRPPPVVSFKVSSRVSQINKRGISYVTRPARLGTFVAEYATLWTSDEPSWGGWVPDRDICDVGTHMGGEPFIRLE